MMNNSIIKYYIPINKGNYDLDTKKRSESFSKKLASGWDEEYNKYRELWYKAPNNKSVLEYPILVDLELSSKCNLKCPMCATIKNDFRKNIGKGNMDVSLAKKIIDEIAGKSYSLRLSWAGEPTLNKHLIEIIKYAKEKNIKEVSFLTNGVLLNQEYFAKLQKAGVDWITISVDGLNETYNEYRSPLKYKELFEKIKSISEYKINNKLQKPVIKIQALWPAIKNNAELFYNTFEPYSDLIAFNPLIEYYDTNEYIEYEDNFSCPMLYQRITVSSSGRVALCSNDDEVECVIGDANLEKICDIWHGEKINRIRELHKKQEGFKNVDVCAKCYYPRKMKDEELVTINSRKIIVKNYISRKI